MLEYINKKYKPSSTDVVVEYYVEPNGISLEEAAENLAAESSIGTWTDISTMNQRVSTKLRPWVFDIDKEAKEIRIAYHGDLFEEGNMPGILSGIAGNIYGMKCVRRLRLQDIEFPKFLIKSFKGPAFGIDGVRKLLKIRDRPLTGTIIKPKMGLNYFEHANVAYDAWTGGLDVVKDDENLTSQKFNPFKERVEITLQKLDKAEQRTGEKKAYMPNITAETNEMLRRADFIKQCGGTYMMIDVLTAGFAGVQTLREANKGLVIHAHRAGHAAVTRNTKHGITMLALAKMFRMIGVDQLHIGAAFGKMEGAPSEVRDICDEIEMNMIHPKKPRHILEQKWYDVKPVFAVCSGGLHPGKIGELVNYMGKNIVIQAGGGVHGHPGGTRKGAMAMRQAVDAAMKGIHQGVYARSHDELRKAIGLWGV
nr:RuBisCO long chain, Form III-b [uncultured archaeon]